MPPSRSGRRIEALAPWLELGLDAAAVLFLPVLALVSHGLAALEAIAGILALGLAAGGGRAGGRALAAPAAIFAVLVAWGAISAAWSPIPAHSLTIALRLAGLFAAGLALAAAAPVLAAPERLVRCFFAGFALGVAILIVQRATGGWLTRPFFVRGFVAPLLPAVAAATIAVLVGTAAQASLVAGVITAPLFYRWRAMLAPAAALAAVLVVVTAPLTFSRLAQIGPVLHIADRFKSSVPHRLLIWSFVGDRIAEKPLLGWGLDASRAIPGGKEWIRPGQPWLPLHPHNAPLQLWLELGVPGAVLLALVMAGLWRRLGVIGWPRLFAAASAGGLAAAMTETLGTYGIWEEWWIGTLWFALFLILVMARTVAARPQNRSQARAAST